MKTKYIELGKLSRERVYFGFVDIVNHINETPDIKNVSFTTNGWYNVVQAGDLKAHILPPTNEDDEMYDPLNKNHIPKDRLSEEGVVDDLTVLYSFWVKFVYKLLYFNNPYIESYFIKRITKSIEGDKLTINYKLDRTKGWTESNHLKHPTLGFFEDIIKESCNSGHMLLFDSAMLPRGEYIIECSNGDHTCSVHPSQMGSHIQSHEDGIVNNIERLSKEQNHPITITKRFGVHRKQGMFASWHYHKFKIRVSS